MPSQWVSHTTRITKHNVATLRSSPWAELSGSLGDLGTLLPLMVALALQGSIQLDSTLVFSGVFNILTGLIFGIPLPVQPMKVCEPEVAESAFPLTLDRLLHRQLYQRGRIPPWGS
jgi:hypothetical protein